MNFGLWMGCWKNCGWVDGITVKTNIGTHLEGWWSCERELDFIF